MRKRKGYALFFPAKRTRTAKTSQRRGQTVPQGVSPTAPVSDRDNNQTHQLTHQSSVQTNGRSVPSEKWQQSLQANIEHLQWIFDYPANQDLVIRQIFIPSIQRPAAVMSLTGVVDKDKIEKMVLLPLMQTGQANQEVNQESAGQPANNQQDKGKRWDRQQRDKVQPDLPLPTLTYLSQYVIPLHEVEGVDTPKKGVDALLGGMALLLVEGEQKALSLSTTSFEHRQVEKPQNERIIKGPLEAFVESLEVNHSLIRKILRDERLVAEALGVGERKMDKVTLMYIKGLTQPELVRQVRERVMKVPVGYLQNISLLEQYIEERSYSLIPSLLYTERPDRAVSFLREGYVVLLMNDSPACLVAPVTFWSLFHTAEDMYERWPYGNFIRLLRLFALFVALFTPAAYISVTNYHIEMLPTDLLMSIAATRERVPFPTFIEVLLMEISFELIREAGIRVPNPIGPTIGIVGALILGQASVQANIVSPILVIVVALTGLSSYVIPEVSLNFTVRISRFLVLGAALVLGFLGVAIYLVLMVGYASSVKSFGVPFFAPVSPYYPASSDTVVRAAVWRQWLRPTFVKPSDPEQIPPSRVQRRMRQRRKGIKR